MNTLTNLYGSSHSYLQNLCEGNACNQMGNGLQELRGSDAVLYQIGPDGCGQVRTSSANVVPTLAYDPSLKPGTCASAGYPNFTGTQVVNLPQANLGAFGRIVVAKYAKPFTLYQVGFDGCGQVEYTKQNEQYIQKYDSLLKEGTCADHGYSLAAGSEQYQVPGGGAFSSYKIDKFQKAISFYQIGPMGCGQIETYEANVAPTLAFDKSLKPGTCAAHGYTESTGTQQVDLGNKALGAFGMISVAKFVIPTTFYQIGPNGCGQISTNAANVAPTLAYDKSLKPGTCASQGYTQYAGRQNVKLPEANLGKFGNIRVTKYTFPSLLENLMML